MHPLLSLASPLLIATPIVTLGYLALCLFWPFRACRRCQGEGRRRGPLRGVRLCTRCEGTGLRLRLGRRVLNVSRRLSRDIRSHRDN